MTTQVRRPGAAVRAYLLFERFTLIDPGEMRARRRGWPAWRRALRVVGAAAWWIGVALRIVWSGSSELKDHDGTRYVLASALLSITALCIVLGVGLEWRDRRREGRHIVD